jgi:putative ABC transport system permease protein
MTRPGRLVFRAASLLIPVEWRGAVTRDLEDEAAAAGRGGWWCAYLALLAAVKLRQLFIGDSAMTELKHAVRSLIRARGFSLGAIATYALGIGVNVAVFSAVDRALFRPLPYARPNELVIMGEYGVGAARPYGTLPMSYVARARSLDGIVDASQATWNAVPVTINEEPGDDGAVRLSEASYNALTVLGVKVFAGRDFSESDARDRHRVALVSYEAWQGRFGRRADLVGTRLWHERQPVDVVGILPPQFINASNSLDPKSDGLILDFVDFSGTDPRARAVPATLRLKPGVSVAAAQAQVNAMVSQLRASDPPKPPSRTPTEIRLVPVRQVLFGGYASYLWLVTASAALVFLLATANLASLMLVRGRSRAQEHALRTSLGATRRRLMLAGLAEALVLSLAGSAVALLVLAFTNNALNSVLPPVFSRYSAGLADGRVLAAVILFASIGAVIAGVAPGWRSGRVDVLAVLQQGGRGASRRAGGRSLLVIETAIGLLFVAGAVATSRNLIQL